MITGQIIDVWVFDEGIYKMKLAMRFDGGFVDVSSQPIPVEAPVIVEFTVSDTVYDDILADNDYGIGAILYSEVVEDGT